jgi:Mrp family chromosome partitioning ATPase
VPSDSGAWSWQAPRQLPAPTADLTGRSAEVAAISAALTGHPRPVVLVTGTIGVGKSTVAAAAAHAAAPGFPDGRLWAALSAVPPTTAGTGTLLAGFLGALGVPDEHIPTGVADRAALYRTVLAERRVLVVLDDADGTDAAERVAALLPGTPGSAVLLCARSRPLLGVTHWTRLAPLSGADSAELITAIIGPARAAAEPAAVAALASACDGLPLALRGAATRLARRPAWSVASLAARLADRTRLLGELRSTDPGIDSRFERSLGQLVPAQVRALTALAATGRREWTPTAAAALLGLPEEQAEQLLDALVETALLDSPAPGGYVLQELAAAFARRRAADAYTSFATPSVAASAVVSSVASAVAPVMPARAS